MISKRALSSGVIEVWTKLNNRWNGEAADVFYREYIVRISEITESFENSCGGLDQITSEMSNELDMLEQSLSD